MREKKKSYRRMLGVIAAFSATGIICAMTLQSKQELSVSAKTQDVKQSIFSETFDTEEDFAKWKIVDNNGGRSWEFLRGTAAYMLDYQTGLPGDDWLISPEIEMSSELVYEFTFSLAVYSRDENFKVMLGNSENPESFTQLIGDFPGVVKDDSGIKTFRISVEQSGNYRLGFYSYSEASKHRFEIDNIDLSTVAAKTVPAKVEELTSTADAEGKHKAVVSFRTPSTRIGGAALSEITSAEIYRNEEEEPCKVFASPAMDTQIEWEDENAPYGELTYTVYCNNAEGRSEANTATTFVGSDIPLAVETPTAAVDEDMNVILQWNEPAGTLHNGYYNRASLTYKVVKDDQVIAENIMQTRYTIEQPVTEGQQTLAYKIIAVTDGGEGAEAAANKVMCGIAMTLPYSESFNNESYQGVEWMQDDNVADFDWELSSFEDSEEIEPQDGDKGMLRAGTYYSDYGRNSRIVTPILSFTDITNPVLTFYLCHSQSPWYDAETDGEQNDRVKIQISMQGGEFIDLENATFYSCKDNKGWTKCEVSLAGYKAPFINLGFYATADGGNCDLLIDNVRVEDAGTEHDLKVTDFTVSQKRANVGETTTFELTLFNKGAYAAEKYSIALYKGDEKIKETAGAKVEASSSSKASFELTATLDDAGSESSYHAEIVFAEDQITENNISSEIVCSVREPELNKVTDLTASAERQNVTLEWSAAENIEQKEISEVQTITDDFESYEAFIIDNIGNWTLRDNDEMATLATPRLPVYPHKGEKMAYQVFNPASIGVTDDYAFISHSGEQYLGCMSLEEYVANDDWLISPMLDGKAQTISFFARGASFQSESIIVYYSLTDTHEDSFIQISEGSNVYVHDVWQQYDYQLPAEARYFAIRCVSKSIMLMIDDITYNIYNGSVKAQTLLGYNIYQNGIKINDNPVSLNNYSIENLESGLYTYKVTAVYAQGESAYSESVNVYVEENSISKTMLDDLYSVEGNAVVFKAAADMGANIYSIEGKNVYHSETINYERVELERGVYIIKAGNRSAKICINH